MNEVDKCIMFIAGMVSRGYIPADSVKKNAMRFFPERVVNKALHHAMFEPCLSKKSVACFKLKSPGALQKFIGLKAKRVSDL